MKRFISILLACAMLFGICACTPEQEIEETKAPVVENTTEIPTLEITAEPTPTDDNDMDAAFEEIDREIFIDIVTSDGLTYHQYVIDPAYFGIEEAEVERGWGDFSYEAYQTSYEETDELMEKLENIDREQLNESNKIAYDNIMWTLEISYQLKDYFYYEEPLTPLNGDHITLPLMMTLYDVASKDDIETYLILLEDMPRYIGQIEQFEVEKANQGLFMTENALDQVVESCRDFTEDGETFFLLSYFEELLENPDFGLSDQEKASYIDRNNDCILNGILPAYDKLANTLDSLRDKCSAFEGAAARGQEMLDYYELGVKNSGACNFDLSETSSVLEGYCAMTYLEMYMVILENPYATNDYGKAITSGSCETDIEYLKTLIESVYPPIPEQQIEYVDVPEALAEDFSPAAYLIAAYDDPTRNVVMFNPTADNNTLLFTLAHECFPGHLYQTQYFRNNENIPFSQQLLAPSGYTEGWAVFSEMYIAGVCEEYGEDICTITQLESILCNILIPAYISIQVNANGWTKDDITTYLEDYGLNTEAYVDIIYEYAVDMPLYFFDYALGYTYTSLIYDTVDPLTDQKKLDFFTEYLNYGPCMFDILFEKFNVR